MPSPEKSFTAPAWILAVGVFLKACLVVLAMVSMRVYLTRKGLPLTLSSYYLPDWTLIVLIVIQVFVYRAYRYKIYNRRWAMTHVLLMLLVLVFIPFFYSALVLIVTRKGYASDYTGLLITLNHVKTWIFWLLLAIANIFFIANLVKSHGRQHPAAYDDIDAIGTG